MNNARATHSLLKTLALTSTLTAGLITGLAGCNTDPVKPPLGSRPDQLPASQYPKVNIVDDNRQLQNFLVIDGGSIVAIGPVDDKPLNVMVPVRSTADNRMRLQYQFYWRDSNGVTIGQSGWRRYEAEPRTQFQASANAITLEAVDWRLEIRSAR